MSLKNLTGLRLHNCELCGFTYKLNKLQRDHNGLLVCKACVDDLDPYISVLPLGTPRANSTSLEPVNSPTVVTLTSAGITSLARSFASGRDVLTDPIFVIVVEGEGDVTVTGTPAIVAGATSQRLCLVGISDENSVTFTDGRGISLRSSITLKANTVLNLTYDVGTASWVETSRSVAAYNTYSNKFYLTVDGYTISFDGYTLTTD